MGWITKTLLALATLLVGATLLGAAAGPAWADEPTDERMRMLEDLVRKQAEQLAAIQRELGRLQRGRETDVAPAGVVPTPAAVPIALGAAAPAPASLPLTSAQAEMPTAPARAPRSREAPEDPFAGAVIRQAGGAGRSGSHGLSLAGVRWGGYLTVEYVANSTKNSFIDLHRFVLEAKAELSDCIDLKTEIEIEHGGVSDELEGEVVIEHMDLVFRLADGFNPKVGALLIPFGRYNRYHDDPWNDFTQRPWTARYLVPTGFGQPGIGAEGAFRAGPNTRFTYDVAVTQGYDDDFTAAKGVREARQLWKRDNNEAKQFWGRAAVLTNNRMFDFLEAGVSGTWTRYDDAGDNDLYGVALDLTARKGPFELHSEYVRMHYDRDAADPADAVRGQEALWAELAYHFFPTPLCGRRNCLIQPTSHFTLAFRYQWMDTDDRRRGAHFNDDLTGYGLALNYRITESSVIRIDHTWLDAAREPDQRELTLSFSTFF